MNLETSILTTISIVYHSTLISLNRHFIRPTPGFARKNHSREICMTSVDNIIAILRHYRSHFSLPSSPIILTYGAIMAGTALCFTQETHTTANNPAGDVSTPPSETEIGHQVTSIVKMLEEASETCPPAREASLRLKERFGISDSRRQGQQSIPLRTFLGKRKRTFNTSDTRENHSSEQITGNSVGDDDLSGDPMALMSSMDPGILDLMPMDWPDVDNDDFWNLRNVEEGQM